MTRYFPYFHNAFGLLKTLLTERHQRAQQSPAAQCPCEACRKQGTPTLGTAARRQCECKRCRESRAESRDSSGHSADADDSVDRKRNCMARKRGHDGGCELCCHGDKGSSGTSPTRHKQVKRDVSDAQDETAEETSAAQSTENPDAAMCQCQTESKRSPTTVSEQGDAPLTRDHSEGHVSSGGKGAGDGPSIADCADCEQLYDVWFGQDFYAVTPCRSQGEGQTARQ